MESSHIAPSPEEFIAALESALEVQRESMLLRHEIAYKLGQGGYSGALPALRALLGDESEDEIVRHEAAEAIAAIGAEDEVLQELEQYTAGDGPLAHTCQLAAEGLRRRMAGVEVPPVCACQYSTKDPAPGLIDMNHDDVPELATALQNPSLPLYERYLAMFSLRNIGGNAAVRALCEVLRNDTSSEVLRHEVAFVLGQIEDGSSTAALVHCLAAEEEHCMVRHEAAIALGAVGGAEAEAALRTFTKHSDAMVSESCEVALATIAYWRAWDEFEARITGGASEDDT